MNDNGSTLLIVLAGLVVAFLIWKRKDAGAAAGDAPQIPLTSAAPVIPEVSIPLSSPVTRGGPPAVAAGAPPPLTTSNFVPFQPARPLAVAMGPALATRSGWGHF
jgi:hypothetical protein